MTTTNTKLFELDTLTFEKLIRLLDSFKKEKEINIQNSVIEQSGKDRYIQSDLTTLFKGHQINCQFNIRKNGIKSLRKFTEDIGNIEFYEDNTSRIIIKKGKNRKVLSAPSQHQPPINTANLVGVSESTILSGHYLNHATKRDFEKIRIVVTQREIESLYFENDHYVVEDEKWVLEEYSPKNYDFVFESGDFLPFKAESFNISIWVENDEYWLITTYDIDVYEVASLELLTNVKQAKEVINYYDSVYQDWKKYGFYTPVPELKKGDRVLTDISPTNYDTLLDFLKFFTSFSNLHIVDGVINHEADVIIQSSLDGIINGNIDGINFIIEDITAFIKTLKEKYGTKKVDLIPALLTSRANIVVVERVIKPDVHLPFKTIDKYLSLLSTLPVPINEKAKQKEERHITLDLKPIERLPSIKPFDDAIPTSKQLIISKEQRQSLAGDKHYVLISLFGNEISRLQSKVDMVDHGITAKLIDGTPTMILKSEHFLKYVADKYQISIIEKDGYWLETIYTFVGQQVKTYEKLEVITQNIIEKIIDGTGMRAQLDEQKASLTLDMPDDQNALNKIHGIMEILINLDDAELEKIYTKYVGK
jgi:hypothetical protein